MLYSQALEFIHSIARFGSKPGLRRVGMLLERMGNPQDKLKFVHVAGTNGKGSTCTMLSYVLADAGYKTGLFISPYVVNFCERIQLNNEMISEEELAASTELVKGHWDELNSIGETPTEFEVVTAVAMDYFLRMGCDIVVLEVGLGGRFDATNIIKTPLCSVITSIDIDHAEILGDTIPKIAMEKCGIIKPGGLTVSYPAQITLALDIITKTCTELKNELFVADKPEIYEMDIMGSSIGYDGLKIHVPLPGAHQTLNAATVVETVKALRKSGLSIDDGAVLSGIDKARFPSRIEVLCHKPFVMLDGAHNPSGAKCLAEAIKLLEGRRVHAVMGVMADKDVAGIMKEVLPHCASIIAVAPKYDRAMPVGDIARLAATYCDNVYIAGSMGAAVIQAVSHCGNDDAVLIFGSFYLASEIRPIAQSLLKRFI